MPIPVKERLHQIVEEIDDMKVLEAFYFLLEKFHVQKTDPDSQVILK